jgi:hypothetical protein
VLGARDRLLLESPLLLDAAATGQIVVRAAVYDLATGVVAFEKSKVSSVAHPATPLAAAEHGH